MKNPEIAVAFTRSASADQNQKSESIASQYEAIAAYAKKHGIEIQKTFDSNTENANATLRTILGYCDANPGVKYLLVRDMNRLTRNLADYTCYKATFTNHGVAIRATNMCDSDSDTPMGPFTETFMALVGKLDNSMRSEHTKKAMLRRAKQGYSVQRPPLGYAHSLTRGVYEKTNTASALWVYFRQVLSGDMSTHELRKAISHIYHPGDKLISFSKFRKLVSNPYYIGFVSCQGSLYKGLHEPILTPEEQQQLIKLLGQ